MKYLNNNSYKGIKGGEQRANGLRLICQFFFTFILLFLIFILPAVVPKILPTQVAQADTIEELQKKIEEKNRSIEQLNKEIQLYSELTDKTSQQAISLQRVIKDLEASTKIMDLEIKRLRQKIDVTNLDIQKISSDIGTSEEKIASLRDGISSSIRELDRSEDSSLVENLLANKNLSVFLSEINSQLSFNDAVQQRLNEVQSEKKKLENNKQAEEIRKKDLVKMQSELSDRKKVVENNKSEQSQALKETKNQEKNFQKILKDKIALKESFEKEIFEFESKIKYTLDPSSIPKTGKLFSWPVDKVIITQKFGKTVAAKRLYVSGSHNGTDFGVPIGTRVKAMSEGVVLGTGDTDLTCKGASFGRWVFIRYDNGLSAIFGHLSVITAKEGQRVTTGDVVGYSGNTGYSTGPHLHVSVYAADAVSVQERPSASCGGRIYRMPIAPIEAYLDPLAYLPSP